ncbi:hypothetical protein Nepgr_029179 [Nepenthes gracilis]|uniref:RING-type domain-containing protein n=1 Tax=Nepenthes gracilis TaxID=150966 RepID=A0AAD3TE96_NEPGR|nr:hypothetical protein Nepgr_029179 [Nepenthes gracilis]
MDVSSQAPRQESQTDQYPLLREQRDINVNHEPSNLPDVECPHDLSPCTDVDMPTSSNQAPVQSSSPSPGQSSSQSFSFMRESEGLGRHRWSPFSSDFWIFVEILYTLGLIIAAIVVLCLSRHEHPRAPLFAWVVAYTAACFISLPILFWGYLHRSRVTEQELAELNQDFRERNSASDPSSFITISLSPSSNHEDQSAATYNGPALQVDNPRIDLLVGRLKMALDYFFMVWFIVGNVWIFGGHSSASEAPKLYRLCVVYISLSSIGYAMPFLLCALICCCIPCLISLLGVPEDQHQPEGASNEFINMLPTYKFTSKKNENGSTLDTEADGGGGIVGAGTEKERAISGEDAVCCICLEGYVDEDELRELPCSHLFHAECVARWLRINASCPVCKSEIVERIEDSSSLTISMQ